MEEDSDGCPLKHKMDHEQIETQSQIDHDFYESGNQTGHRGYIACFFFTMSGVSAGGLLD